MLDALRAAPPGERWLVGSDDALGAILERLAFDTEVDLEQARRVLLAAWQALATRDREAQPHAVAEHEERDVRDALATFDRGRAEGRDLESLFRDLERDLGLEVDDDAADDLAPDFPGVVGAIVEEFLWDVEREQGVERARQHASLRSLAQFGASIGVFENLGADDLLGFAGLWMPERGDLGGADEAQRLVDSLGEFCRWAQERQGVALWTELEPKLATLARSLPRVTEVNVALGAAPTDTQLEHAEWIGRADRQQGRVRDRHGVEISIAVPPQIASKLEPGDPVRIARDERGGARLARAYPPECADLLRLRS